MKALTRLKNLMICADAQGRSMDEIYDAMCESNRASTEIFSLLAAVFMGPLTVVSCLVPALATYRVSYALGTVTTLAVFLISRGPARKNPRLTTMLMYFLVALLFAVGIVMGTAAGPNELAATFVALLLTVPQMFVDRPWRFLVVIFTALAAFVAMAVVYKNPVTLASDISNVVTFGILSAVICTFNMKFKVSRLHLENTVRYMAETDQLTGLKNRHSYEQRLESVAILNAKSIYCVYVDVNGLHELNNTQGHDAGDRMLCLVAGVMRDTFGKEDTFRVGGDEFIAIGVNRSLEEVERRIQRLKREVEAAGYHVAVGCDFRDMNELEVRELIRRAEENMFRDKSAFYRQAANDRRKR